VKPGEMSDWAILPVIFRHNITPFFGNTAIFFPLAALYPDNLCRKNKPVGAAKVAKEDSIYISYL